MQSRSPVIPFLLVLGMAGCSACQDNGVEPDVFVPDTSVPDATVADTGDLTPISRDTGATWDVTCGGSRILTPKPVQRGTGDPCGKACRQMTFGDHVADGYEAKGDLLVYTGADVNDEKVFMVDLKADKEWMIQERPHGLPGCYAVSTDGAQVAYSCQIWTMTSSGLVDLFVAPIQLFNPASNVEQDLQCPLLTSSKGYRPDYLGLGTTGIVATMSLPPTPQGNVDAFFHRFSDGKLLNLTQKYGGVWETRISGRRAVWTEAVGSTTQIVLYDTVTDTKTILDPTGKPQFLPRIKGDKVVWVDHRNAPGDMWNQGNSDIYLHDLSTGKTVAVTTNPARQSFPDVWGDWVVWEDWRNNPNPTPRYSSEFKNADIFARNMKTGQEVQLTSLKGMEIRPIIDQHHVFFQAAPVYQIALFMIDLDQLGY